MPVDPERLAAYLDGDLDAAEAAALEAALARDPALRARLDAMRHADEALAALPAATPPPGYEARLRQAVDAELAVQLATDTPSPAASDELAARRARRSWVPAFAGAAAGVALLAAVGIAVTGLGRGDDADTAAMDADTDEAGDGALMMESLEADEAAPLPGPGQAPTVVVGDRELDDDEVDALLDALELQAVVGRDLDLEAGAAVARDWRASLRALVGDAVPGPPSADDVEDDTVADAAPRAEGAAGPVRFLAEDEVDDETLAAATVCIDEVAAGTDAIVAYAELARLDGRPAVLVGLVTPDPATERFRRPEAWLVELDGCQVRRFAQG
jgi:hypothetical protein